MIPSSCLNCTISGLISRTFLRTDIIGIDDFHGAAYYKELYPEDRTYEFINYIEGLFRYDLKPEENKGGPIGMKDVENLSITYGIKNNNYIKPGIGETTRVLLRRVPWKVVIDERYRNDKELEHIKQLAKEKQVSIEYVHLNNYKCCGIIKQLSDV